MVVLPPIVFDSTVLINLAKARLLESLRNLPEALIVPREIHGETVVEGQRLAHPDAQAIVAALGAGILRLRGGTGHVLARLLRTGILTQREARTHLDRMIAKGWWVTVETYSRLLEELGR